MRLKFVQEEMNLHINDGRDVTGGWSQDELVNFTCVGNVFSCSDEAICEFVNL